jgi:ribosomal protein S18 acetylase RimI-like enzyme
MAGPGEPARSRRRAIYIGPVRDLHNEALGSFFEASWGRPSSASEIASWRTAEAAQNPVEPGVEPPKWVFVRGESILGYLGTIPDSFHTAASTFDAYWLKGFWVDPEFRSGPIGYELVGSAVAELGATCVSTVAPEARRLFEAHGLRERGLLFNRLRLLRPARLLARLGPRTPVAGLPAVVRWSLQVLQATRTSGLAGGLVSAATAAATAFAGRAGAGFRTRQGWEELDHDALDRLWERTRTSLEAATVRDARLVKWRYGGSEAYVPVSVWRGDELAGWAVVRRPSQSSSGRLPGISVASLSDLLFEPADRRAGLAVVAAAERAAMDLDVDALLCSGTHAALRRALARRGFLPLPGNVHFMARDDGDRVFPGAVGRWWLTRGDAQSDGAF